MRNMAVDVFYSFGSSRQIYPLRWTASTVYFLTTLFPAPETIRKSPLWPPPVDPGRRGRCTWAVGGFLRPTASTVYFFYRLAATHPPGGFCNPFMAAAEQRKKQRTGFSRASLPTQLHVMVLCFSLRPSFRWAESIN